MNILSLSWFVRNMQSYHILTCRDKTGKIHIFFSHQHAWYPLLDMGISLLRIWCILFGSIFLSLLLPRIRDSSIFWKLTITKLNRSYSFLATLPLELVIIYRYIYIYIIPNPSKSHIVCYIHMIIFHDIPMTYRYPTNGFWVPAQPFFFHSSFWTKQSPRFAFGETPAFRWCLFKRYMVRSHHWITAQLLEITWNNTSNFNMEAPTNSAWKMILWFSGWMWQFFWRILGGVYPLNQAYQGWNCSTIIGDRAARFHWDDI